MASMNGRSGGRTGFLCDETAVVQIKPKSSWINLNFLRRECCLFAVSSSDDQLCVCGKDRKHHGPECFTFKFPETDKAGVPLDRKWSVMGNTCTKMTDAYGQIEFQSSANFNKAQYARLASETAPLNILQLFMDEWHLELPKLLISVHGGIANFELQPKLQRVFRKGLIKAATTTGAWILTGGTNTGVIKHVGEALSENGAKSQNKKKIVAIGIAPWGVVHKKEDLIGKDVSVDYHMEVNPKGNTAVLNSSHNYFLLADNGTTGRYGAEVQLRKKLERYMSKKKSRQGIGVPLVCMVLEGGTNTIRTVLECVTEDPPVPVVVCDGSGRAADLIAFAHKFCRDDGTLQSGLKDQLIATIKRTYSFNAEQAEDVYKELLLCIARREMITVFCMGEGEQNSDIDLAILTALLKSHNMKAPDQLSLALSWDRVDLARSHIFTCGREWTGENLDKAMMEALENDKVEFVKLLLERGVNMKKFLTYARLEKLYNPPGSTPILDMMVRDLSETDKAKRKSRPNRITLMQVGRIVNGLMGSTYYCEYSRRIFRRRYVEYYSEACFQYPFSDLLVWAILMNRQKMAQFMWQREDEALSKAIIACQLYNSLSIEAAEDAMLDNEVSEELSARGKEYSAYAVDVLDCCYKQDNDRAQQLLTYELKNWNNKTCLSLAHSCGMKDLIAHPCCQNLITEMWLGGLSVSRHVSFKVIMCIIFPFACLTLHYKTIEQLKLTPHTKEKHVGLDSADGEEEEEHRDEDLRMVKIGDMPETPSITPSASYYNISMGTLGRSENKAEPSEKDSFTGRGGTLNKPQLSRSMYFLQQRLQEGLKVKRNRKLSIGKKLSEFYTAPITKFWMHFMSFILFMGCYCYMLLVKLSRWFPHWTEWYCVAYVLFHSLELLTEMLVSRPHSLLRKMKLYFYHGHNLKLLDMLGVFVYAVAFITRMTAGDSENQFLIGRLLYCVDIVFWFIKLLEMCVVSKNFGPYLFIMYHLVVDMLEFIFILFVVLCAFGVPRQAILNPYKEPSWHSLTATILEPYFMLYGEVYAGSINPPCGPGEEIGVCLPGRWIVPIIMTIFLLIANILLLTLLVAKFNNTFTEISSNSKAIWMSQRYMLTLQQEQRLMLPPPLSIFSFIYLFFKSLVHCCLVKRSLADQGLKIFLEPDALKKLHVFEQDCVVEYFKGKELRFAFSNDERIRVTNDRVENMTLHIEELQQKENCLRSTVQTLEARAVSIEGLVNEQLEMASQLQESFGQVTYMQVQMSDMQKSIAANQQAMLEALKAKSSSHKRTDEADNESQSQPQESVIGVSGGHQPNNWNSAVPNQSNNNCNTNNSCQVPLLNLPPVAHQPPTCQIPLLNLPQIANQPPTCQIPLLNLPQCEHKPLTPKPSYDAADGTGQYLGVPTRFERRRSKSGGHKKRKSNSSGISPRGQQTFPLKPVDDPQTQSSLLLRRRFIVGGESSVKVTVTPRTIESSGGGRERESSRRGRGSVVTRDSIGTNGNTGWYEDVSKTVGGAESIEEGSVSAEKRHPLIAPPDSSCHIYENVYGPLSPTSLAPEPPSIPSLLPLATKGINSHGGEYSSITDDIDLTCMIEMSPPNSPETYVRSWARASSLVPPTEEDQEALSLLRAEEVNRRVIGSRLISRIRQLSNEDKETSFGTHQVPMGLLSTDRDSSDPGLITPSEKGSP